MSVAILLVTHEHIGCNMLKVTASILGDKINNTACIEVPMDSNRATMKHTMVTTLENLSVDEGILFITDSFGSTPHNIAAEFIDHDQRTLISGLNLPMLIRLMNYRTLPLDELTQVAIDGGRRGITSHLD